MAAPAKQQRFTSVNDLSFGFEYSIPNNWHTTLMSEAERLLTHSLLPYIEECFLSAPDLGFCVGKGTKLLSLKLHKQNGNTAWKKEAENPFKIGAPPATGVDHFLVYLLRKNGDRCFEASVKVLRGGHEAAVRMHTLLTQGPPENKTFSEVPKKEKSLVIEFPPITRYVPTQEEGYSQVTTPVPEPVMATASEVVVEAPAETVSVSNEAVIEKPNDTAHDNLLLLLIMVHEQANKGKGFALPVSAGEFGKIRLNYIKQNPDCISVPASDTRAFGAAIGRFTKSAQDNGFLVRRKTDDAWFLTGKSAQELGIEGFAKLDSSQIKPTNSPCLDMPVTKAPASSPNKGDIIHLPKPRPVPALVLEPVLSQVQIDGKIFKLNAEKLSNEEKISHLQKRNELIPKEIEDLMGQKVFLEERRKRLEAEEVLRQLEKKIAEVRAGLEKPAEITEDDFKKWKEDFEG